MEFIKTIYYVMIFANLLLSLYLLVVKGVSKGQHYLYVYFGLLAFFDVLPPKFWMEISDKIYILFLFSLMVYFFVFYYQEFAHTNFKNIYISVFVALFAIGGIGQFQHRLDGVSLTLLLVLSLFYIFSSILWFYSQISDPPEKKLSSKLEFWISFAQLFWSVFFIFRTVPMYYLQQSDPSFLTLLTEIHMGVNVLTYIFFFKGMLCKL